MNVEFSDESIADLWRLYPEDHKFIAVKCAIVYYLKNNKAEKRAVAVPAFPNRDMYNYPIDGDSIVLYELQKEPRRVFVWSVHESSGDVEEPE